VREVAHARKRNPLSDVNKILQGGRYSDVITYANFGEDRLRGSNLPFSIDFDRRPYAALTLYARIANASRGRKQCRLTSAGRMPDMRLSVNSKCWYFHTNCWPKRLISNGKRRSLAYRWV